jgi:hypothetical protein
VITKVGRGSRMRGLVAYLFGPGTSDEHTNQRVVAAYDDILVGDRGDTELGVGMLTAELDFPRKVFAPEVDTDFVYHVSISNKAGADRALTDEEWRDVADTAADRLGFNDGGPGGRVRWIAVHHGASANGNDHIHLVANLVREDGRKHYFTRPDFTVLAEVRAEMETKYGLTVTGRAKTGLAPVSRLEVQQQRSTGLELRRERLRRAVLAAGTAARTESEFVDTLRRGGVIVRPRWEAETSRTAVVGYSVALPSPPGPDRSTPALVWFGGGKLDRHLTLQALRGGWATDPAAVDTWRTVDTRGPAKADALRPEVMVRAQQEVARIGSILTGVPLSDRARVSATAREAAGVLAAAAERVEGQPAYLLGRAADQLYRAAEREPRTRPPVAPAEHRLATVARAVLTVQTASRGGPAGMVVLLHQVLRLAQTIQRTHATAGRLTQARAAALAGVHVRAAATALDPSVVIGGATRPRPVLTPQTTHRGRTTTTTTTTQLPGMTPGTTQDRGIGR